ncbi:MAG: sulfatase [Phycisphaeraceae bacterium]
MPIRVLLVVVVWLVVGVPGFSQARAADRPNVLLICIDDLNDWVGCMDGHPQALTPNIDRLAQRGVLFTNAHCQSPVCWASRASFMSGKLPSTTGVYLLGGDFRESPALKDAKQLADLFNDAGYVTMGTGKIYHNRHGTETFQAYGPKQSFGPIPTQDEGGKINYKQGHPLWDWGAYPDDETVKPDYRIASWAAEQLKKQHDKPLFLAVGMCRPHVPMYAPPKYFDMLPPLDKIVLPAVKDGDRDDLPDYGKRLTAGFPAPRHAWFLQREGDQQWRKAVRAYLASIAFADAQVGRVLDALDESGRAGNTVVVLLSDHGFHMGEKQRWAKRSLWEESTKVPFIIAAPGMDPGRRCSQPAGLIDMVPTLIELCGLADPGGLDGATLVPQLKDVQTPHAPAITTWWVGNHAVRSARYRYIRYADGSEELYDHDRDPNEWENLAGRPEYVGVIAEHRAHVPKRDHPALPGNAALGVAEEDRAFFGVRH